MLFIKISQLQIITEPLLQALGFQKLRYVPGVQGLLRRDPLVQQGKKKRDISTLGFCPVGFQVLFFFFFCLGYFAFYASLGGDSSLSPAFSSAVVTALSCPVLLLLKSLA